ncbi:MAG: hypothetical protein E6Q97_33000 [Desulfurellales bacterium]|nr:MAG: hypothetical protein E6Q97_33000 [Desulfurellales bacterium]
MLNITIDLGTHTIEAYLLPETESLKFYFTWHHPVIVHSWTLRKLMKLAEEADRDSDYVKAERIFIRGLGDTPRPFKD